MRNSNIFIQENAFENLVCKMASILPRPQTTWVMRSFSTISLQAIIQTNKDQRRRLVIKVPSYQYWNPLDKDKTTVLSISWESLYL